jgi:hypothetical protein
MGTQTFFKSTQITQFRKLSLKSCGFDRQPLMAGILAQLQKHWREF